MRQEGSQAAGGQPNLLNVAFIDTSSLAYDALTPLTRPLGGTQSAVSYLGAAMARMGHKVTLFNKSERESRALDVATRPLLTPGERDLYNGFDALIVPTQPVGRALRAHSVTVPLVCWQHQSTLSSRVGPLSDPAERAAWDQVAFVSEHQRAAFGKAFGLDGVVLRNAPSPPFAELSFKRRYFFDNGSGPRFLYCSAPGRGLDHLLFAFATIRVSLPDATLAIYSDQKIYQIGSEKDEYSVYYELARALPGVEYFGSVPQAELASAMSQADYWIYPTTFVETSCIVMMEAGCAGLGLITSDVGALPETGGSFATLLNPGTTRTGWIKTFAQGVIERVHADRADPVAARARREETSRHFRAGTWDVRAREWTEMLAALVAGKR